MNAKAKKVRKPMSQQTKRNLANIFGSIISNQRAIDGAKELPLWVALIFFALSAFLPVIPSMVTTGNTYGASFVNNNSYNLDRTLSEVTYEMKNEGKEFKVENQLLSFYKNNEVQNDIEEKVGEYINKQTGEYNLQVWYTDQDFTKLATTLLSMHYQKGTTTYTSDSNQDTTYIPSIMILSKNSMYVYVMQESSIKAVSSSYNGCDWKNYGSTESLLTRVIADANHDNIIDYNNKVFGNWKIVFNECYLNAKGYSLLTGTFIYLGIFAALILFMGLMIFLLTRGKKNVFHYLSILTCLKISAWASFTPSLIGLVLGFIFANQATLFFIMVLGLRIMWLCMKQLRPQQY